MKVYTFNSSYPYGSNMYVLESGGEFAVIDPSLDFSSAASKLGFEASDVKYILLTHAHFDHMLFLDSWCESTRLAVSLSYKDAPALKSSFLNCYRAFLGVERGYYGEYFELHHGDALTLGGESIKIMETPGHTEGSISLITSDSIFVGDTVFAGGGVGRCDLPGGDFNALLRSIDRIKKLDNSLTVYSGHGPLTSISNIIKGN